MSQAGIAAGGTGPSGQGILTLTGNTGGAVGPDGSNNVNFPGATLYTVTGSPGTNTLTINPRVNAYPITPYVVGPIGAAGYQTIQSAINAANLAGGGMVYIQPGTYTENLTFFDKIQLVVVEYINDPQTTIIGIHTPPTTGAIALRGLVLQSATDIFNSNAVGSSAISILECTFNITSGYIFNLPNWSGNGFNINDCGELSTNNGVLNNSGTAGFFSNNCQIGAGSTKTFTANGSVRLDLTFLNCPANISGGNLFINFALFGQTLTLSGNTFGNIFLGDFFPGSGPALVMNTSGAINLFETTINTSNNPAISGTGIGILTYEDVIFLQNSIIAGTVITATTSWQPYSRAIAATDGTKVGTCAFNSAQFTVDTNGFVSTSGSGLGQTITGDSGGALSPVAGNWNILGGPGVTTSGSGNTLTINSVVFTDRGASTTVTRDAGSFITAAITLTLPAAPLQGQEEIFVCTNASTLVIKTSPLQLIRIGTIISSVGGTATSTSIGDSVTLRFRIVDKTWYAVGVIGIWTMA